MTKNKTLQVKGTEIIFFKQGKEEYISLADIARYKNSGFKGVEFDFFPNDVDVNLFVLSSSKWDFALVYKFGLTKKLMAA